MSRFTACCSRVLAGLCMAAAAISANMSSAQVVLPPGSGTLAGGKTFPSPAYDAALAAIAAGDFTAGLELANREYQGGIRAGTQRWIDSVPGAALIGEASFELGRLREAVTAYDEALLLAATHGDWLLAVQFPQQPLRGSPQPPAATWGRSQRNLAAAAMPGTMSIRMGGADPQQVLKQGGVLSAPVNYPIRPQEIMRSLVIAIYRRGDILGELGRDGSAIDEVGKALLRRPAPPNHYSQCWIDVALGCVCWSQGKDNQAVPLLNRGLILENQFDHPLAAWALIVLGRIALTSDQPAAAARYFEEASYTAANFGDARALEESLRWAFAAHMATGSREPPTWLAAACDWARQPLNALHVRLHALRAEALATGGNAKAAAAALAEIDPRQLRGELGRGSCGAQAFYATALTNYAKGDQAAAEADLGRALSVARPHTPRLFQTSRLLEMVLAGSSTVSDRQADAWFARLLGDPPPRDFTIAPLATLASMTAPRQDAFDAWMPVASRRGKEAVLNAGESRLRGRWLSEQDLGGRRTSIDRLVASDPDELPREAATRRAALLARYPELARAADDLARVRGRLLTGLPARPPATDPADWKAYADASSRRAQLLAFIAAGRDPTLLEFPPQLATAEIQKRLPARHLILSFQWTAAGLMGALESNSQTAIWEVRQPAAVARELASLARSIGLFDPLAPVSTERLLETDWRPAAERLERLLFENSKIVLGENMDELAIVPDGLLWYLPFELLPVGSGRNLAVDDPAADPNATRSTLRDVCRIRYCPTRSLAVSEATPRRTGAAVGLQIGKLFRGDTADVSQRLREEFENSVDRVVSLPPNAGIPTALAGSLCDTVAILEELADDGPIATRSLLGGPRGRDVVRFGDWLASPPKRPSVVILGGFQTPMAGGLTKLPAQPGMEMFLAATDLIAAGARTVVLSRWRTGGEVGFDLAREFVRDLSAPEAVNETPQEIWERAVDVVTSEQPDPASEPRLKQTPAAILPDAKHPFFWSGYALIQTGRDRPAAEPAIDAALPAADRAAADGIPGAAQ